MRKIQTFVLSFGLLLLPAGLLGAVVEAAGQEEEELTATFELPFYSSYTSRGQVSNDEPVLEPSLTLSKGAFSMNLWGNYNLTDRVTEEPDFSEVDITLEYGLPIPGENFEAALGVLAYTYPNTNDAPSTTELFITTTVPNDYIVPSAEIYFDIDEADGIYALVALDREFELSEVFSFKPAFSTGWGSSNYNHYFFSRDRTLLNDGNVSGLFVWKYADDLQFYGLIAYSWLWDDDIREGAREVYFDDDQLWGGAGLLYDF